MPEKKPAMSNFSEQELGLKIRGRRRELGLTMQFVADQAGLSIGFISQVDIFWSSHQKVINPLRARQLVKHFKPALKRSVTNDSRQSWKTVLSERLSFTNHPGIVLSNSPTQGKNYSTF